MIKHIALIFALLSACSTVFARPFEIDLSYGFGLDEEVDALEYTDGTRTELKVGEGLGIGIGLKPIDLHYVAVIGRFGFRYGFSSGTLASNSKNALISYYYFPASVELGINLPGSAELRVGANYLVKPTYYANVDNFKVEYNFVSDIGYNAELRWTQMYDLDKDIFFYVRYLTNSHTVTSATIDGVYFSDDGSAQPETYSNLSLGAGFSF